MPFGYSREEPSGKVILIELILENFQAANMRFSKRIDARLAERKNDDAVIIEIGRRKKYRNCVHQYCRDRKGGG